MARTGKIARLPRHLRDELNQRLDSGASSRSLVEWLNSQQEVQTILAESFHGDPINEQNLCNWRRGGFADWQARQDFLANLETISETAAGIEPVAHAMADHAAQLLGIYFAVLLSPSASSPFNALWQFPSVKPPPAETPTPVPASPSLPSSSSSFSFSSSQSSPSTPPPIPHLKPLCTLTRAVVSLRRSNQDAARLRLQQSQSNSRIVAEKIPPSLPGHQSPAIPKETPTPPPSTSPREPEIKPNQGKSSLPQSPIAAASPSVLPDLTQNPFRSPAPPPSDNLPRVA